MIDELPHILVLQVFGDDDALDVFTVAACAPRQLLDVDIAPNVHVVA